LKKRAFSGFLRRHPPAKLWITSYPDKFKQKHSVSIKPERILKPPETFLQNPRLSTRALRALAPAGRREERNGDPSCKRPRIRRTRECGGVIRASVLLLQMFVELVNQPIYINAVDGARLLNAFGCGVGAAQAVHSVLHKNGGGVAVEVKHFADAHLLIDHGDSLL
jgi:hypothetical protein